MCCLSNPDGEVCFSVVHRPPSLEVPRDLSQNWFSSLLSASDPRTHRHGLDLLASKPAQLLRHASEHLCLLFWKCSNCIHQDTFYQAKRASSSKGDSCGYMPEIKSLLAGKTFHRLLMLDGVRLKQDSFIFIRPREGT